MLTKERKKELYVEAHRLLNRAIYLLDTAYTQHLKEMEDEQQRTRNS
jgi:hypothetical protein